MRGLLRRNAGFRRLFLASVVSLAGCWLSFVAVARLVTELDGQALMGAVGGSIAMVGAGPGGLGAELFGRQTAFIVDAASFAVAAWLHAGIRRPMQQAVAERGGGSVRAAIGYIRDTPVVLRL